MNIDSLRFNIWSSSLETPSIGLEENDWLIDYDPDIKYSKTVNVKIIGVYDDLDDDFPEIEIGYINGTFIDVGSIDKGEYPVAEIFDCVSQDVYNVYEAIVDRKGKIKSYCSGCNKSVFVLERFYIEKQYRNKGIGKKVLSLLEDLLRYSLNLNIGCIVLLPNAQEKNDQGMLRTVKDPELKDELTKRLIKFYESVGYKKIKGNPHMYKNAGL